VKQDYRQAPLTPRERALADYAVKLTREPASMKRTDLESLRAHGLDDEELLELVHIIGYFNHINRLADALGVDLEDFMSPKEP
jgi:uncharacterized peroxidase-related enzyme